MEKIIEGIQEQLQKQHEMITVLLQDIGQREKVIEQQNKRLEYSLNN